MAGKGHVAEDQPARFMRTTSVQFALPRAVTGASTILKSWPSVIGQDVEDIAAFRHRILDAFLALGHQLRLGGQVLGREQAIFRGLVIMDVDLDEVVEQRAATPMKKPGSFSS